MQPRETGILPDAFPGGGVSVVMVSYRTGPVLFEALEAVLAPHQRGVAEVILVDNGNPPEVVAALARRARTEPRLTIVRGHGNVGFARGCNLGARRAAGRWLLLLNPDCRLDRGAVPALLAEAAGFGGDWLLGCRVRDPDGRDQRGSRRALLTPLTALVETFRLDRLAPALLRGHRLNLHDRPLPARTARTPAVSGACMMLPAATFRAMGGLDEDYFLHVDDLDLCLRLHRAGVPVYFAPHVEAVHRAGSSEASAVRVEWQKTRSFLRYFVKHFRSAPSFPLLVPAIAAGALVRFGVRAARSLLPSPAAPAGSPPA